MAVYFKIPSRVYSHGCGNQDITQEHLDRMPEMASREDVQRHVKDQRDRGAPLTGVTGIRKLFWDNAVGARESGVSTNLLGDAYVSARGRLTHVQRRAVLEAGGMFFASKKDFEVAVKAVSGAANVLRKKETHPRMGLLF